MPIADSAALGLFMQKRLSGLVHLVGNTPSTVLQKQGVHHIT